MTERRLFIRIELTASARARAEGAGLDVNAAASQSLDDRVQVGDRLYVFYNGNDFGREGFAVAVLEEE